MECTMKWRILRSLFKNYYNILYNLILLSIIMEVTFREIRYKRHIFSDWFIQHSIITPFIHSFCTIGFAKIKSTFFKPYS